MNLNTVGLKRGTVKLSSYNDEWPKIFEREKVLLSSALGDLVIDIQHIGSTSIPGMPSKPIIDMMASIPDFRSIDKYIQPLKKLGYEDRGQQGVPDRHIFVKGDEARRTHHLNLTERDSSFWKEHVLFLDYLRTHKEAVDEYAKLKTELAKSFPDDRNSYASAKAEFVKKIVEKARES